MSSLTPRPLAPIAITQAPPTPPPLDSPTSPVPAPAPVTARVRHSLAHPTPPNTLAEQGGPGPTPLSLTGRRESIPLSSGRRGDAAIPLPAGVGIGGEVGPGMTGSTSRPIGSGVGNGSLRPRRGPLLGGFDPAPTPGNTPSSLERIGRRIASNLLVSDTPQPTINRIAPSYERRFTVGLHDLERRLTGEPPEQRYQSSLAAPGLNPARTGSPHSASGSDTGNGNGSGKTGDARDGRATSSHNRDWPTSFSGTTDEEEEEAETDKPAQVDQAK